MLFTSLIILHILGDFYFQPNSWVKDKNKNHISSLKLINHAVIQAIMSCIPILYVTTYWKTILCTFFIVGITHWAIDILKTYKNGLRYLVVDQILHFSILFLISIHASQLDLSSIEIKNYVFNKYILSLTLGFLLILKPTSIFIGTMLSKYSLSIDENKGLISGGETIGYLERIIILIFTITGEFSVIGFILTAKSIFRFGDMKSAQDHKLTEYFLLGTLISVTITITVGLIIKYFILK
ncbi:hypothetical protein HR45_05165 [Shewanella mangrovi]|uniref:DUF3307 domain-containing protein n=1 Tax=Shewanella mangrovi TaxID=1515746 RepID=A0A094LUC7_9GAMM|nr:hypothetical protein HR45_05165 [Shewanella mangrovi]